jgi:hypothetical protein
MLLDFALPDSYDCPSCRTERVADLAVSIPVSADLELPVLIVVSPSSLATVVAVPVATIYEDREPSSRENKIGSSNQAGVSSPTRDAVRAEDPHEGKLG